MELLGFQAHKKSQAQLEQGGCLPHPDILPWGLRFSVSSSPLKTQDRMLSSA